MVLPWILIASCSIASGTIVFVTNRVMERKGTDPKDLVGPWISLVCVPLVVAAILTMVAVIAHKVKCRRDGGVMVIVESHDAAAMLRPPTARPAFATTPMLRPRPAIDDDFMAPFSEGQTPILDHRGSIRIS